MLPLIVFVILILTALLAIVFCHAVLDAQAGSKSAATTFRQTSER
jgi:hypothetical protein